MSEVVPGVMMPCGEEGHAFGSRVRGGEPLAVRICALCGEIDWADLRQQHEAAATARAEAAIQRVDSYVRLLESELDDDQSDDDYSRGRFAAQRQIVADLQERGFGTDNTGGTDGQP